MPDAPTAEPTSLTIRAYQVGFGDCFLLTFKYPASAGQSEQKRHVLIDFGSTGMPAGVVAAEQMMKVANDIKNRCKDGGLQIVVATHRHKDHISGFATKKDGSGTGEVIASLQPKMVIQPWTENPALEDAKLTEKPANPIPGQAVALNNAHYFAALNDMNTLASSIASEVRHLGSAKFRQALSPELASQIEFLSDDNSLPNRSAVVNLATMGQNHYVRFGEKLDVSEILPGVTIHVLGPPDLSQHAEIRKQKAKDENEFWMLQGAAHDFWKLQAASGELIKDFTTGEGRLFPDADIFQDFLPSQNRWFVRQLKTLRGDQLLSLVRILDRAMNNTSVILLFEFAGKKLLFPGDAQIENWEFALSNDEAVELLKDVCVYKVGHHGSRNATPKSLWAQFDRKDEEAKAERLLTINSTMKDKHGHPENNTEVPRSSLVDEFLKLSNYRTTEDAAKANELYIDVEII